MYYQYNVLNFATNIY